ncbi:MAG: thioredoxin domain-containing protein [Pirellulaceae bacterium]
MTATTQHTEVLELNYQDFDEEVYESEMPVLVEFRDNSCFPFRAQDRMLQRLADEFAGQAKVAQVDAIAQWQIAHECGVTTQPTVLVFQNGRIVDRFEGLRLESVYRQALNETLVGYWSI